MARQIYERDMDALFHAAFGQDVFRRHFLECALPGQGRRVVEARRQVRHIVHSGTMDLMLRLDDGQLLLIENKIDAGYSVTRAGDAQPDRYRASVAALAARGIVARSVLLAPGGYLAGSRQAALFDIALSYELLRDGMPAADHPMLDAAILQAAAPYEPDPNAATAAFFRRYYELAAAIVPDLVLKPGPNGDGIRPAGSRTIYVDVPRSLRRHDGIVRPRMSIQCLDSGAAMASAKIMLGGLGRFAHRLPPPEGLRRIGGYLRAAGQSLGCVVDTPHLDTQRRLEDQLPAAQQGLEAARQLQLWWNDSADEARALLHDAGHRP